MTGNNFDSEAPHDSSNC